jgi:hypothetical protein
MSTHGYYKRPCPAILKLMQPGNLGSSVWDLKQRKTPQYIGFLRLVADSMRENCLYIQSNTNRIADTIPKVYPVSQPPPSRNGRET